MRVSKFDRRICRFLLDGTQPATPTSPAPKGGLPKTGDSVPWIPLACLVAAAACGIAILALMRRKGHWDAEDDDGAE